MASNDLAIADAHLEAGRFADAERAYRHILAQRVSPAPMNSLGITLARQGRLAEAEAAFRNAIQIQQDFLPAYENLGRCCQLQEHFADAEQVYRIIIQLSPGDAEAYDHLGWAMREQKKIQPAIPFLQTAVRRRPENSDFHFHLGLLFSDAYELDAAMEALNHALAINPNHSAAQRELAVVLWRQNRFDEAMAIFNAMLARDPQNIDGRLGRAELLLLMGDYEQGWPEYEWRWQDAKFGELKFLKKHRPNGFSQPLWKGENLSGKTLLFYGEQGFGDVIQFVRYAPLLARQGAKIVLQCPFPLKSLIEQAAGIHQVIVHREPQPPCDFYVPMMSLPAVVRTTLKTIPTEIPYLRVPEKIRDSWRGEMTKYAGKLKVGLCWAGRPDHYNDARRSCALSDFAPLARIEKVKFFSLQKGTTAAQAQNPPAGMEIINLTHKLSDFADTAGLIEQLDLVISVDTAIVHLAGALGKKTWTVLPFTPEWRWLFGRDDSPWYPTMRLFQQKERGNWAGLFSEVAEELRKLS
jgi:tetratricopeptide (TPR) repeat protein